MHVLYDGFVYQMQAVGGINRYFANLISQLPHDVSATLLANQVQPTHWPRADKFTLCSSPFPKLFKPLRKVFEQRWFDGQLRTTQADILHPTYYRLLSGRPITFSKTMPVVITVYDMIHELFAEELDPSGRQAELKKSAVSNADMIICISNHTKNDLLERYRVPEDKVKVVHLATDYQRIDPPVSHTLANHPPQFIYVGSRRRYKNFDVTLRSLAQVRGQGRESELVVVGAPFSVQEKQRIDSLGLIPHVHHRGSVSDQELASIYRASVALLYPSHYEGFGIPLLEAMACGTAVIASNRASIPEVAGDAALLFDPHSDDELAAHMVSLIDNQGIRERLLSRGHERVGCFSWDRTVSETVAVYNLLAERHARKRKAA